MEALLGNIYRFITNRYVYHSLSWLVLFIILFYIGDKSQGVVFTLINESISIFFYAIVVYLNLKYLIPKYLANNHFFTWLGLLVLAAVLVTPLKAMVLYFRFEGLPAAQQQLANTMHLQFLVTFMVAGASTLGKITTDWVRHIRIKQELQTKNIESELRFLKSQVNPHFLFNTLNNIYALSLKKSDKAPETVLKLSELMRYMLYECNEERVLLANEVKYVENYIALESLRQGHNIDINLDVVGDVHTQKIAPLMFTPFLENAFKHGVNNAITGGFINITLMVEDEEVNFQIENSKANTMPTARHPRSGGIGLKNLKRRLELVYPDKYELNIEDQPNVYIVHLSIQLD